MRSLTLRSSLSVLNRRSRLCTWGGDGDRGGDGGPCGGDPARGRADPGRLEPGRADTGRGNRSDFVSHCLR